MSDSDLEEEVASGDRRRSLVALRDYLAHELAGHRCNACAMSQLRTGDTAALVLRLTKVMEEIEALPDLNGEVSELERIRARRDRPSNAEDSTPTDLGTRRAARKQGGRTRWNPGT